MKNHRPITIEFSWFYHISIKYSISSSKWSTKNSDYCFSYPSYPSRCNSITKKLFTTLILKQGAWMEPQVFYMSTKEETPTTFLFFCQEEEPADNKPFNKPYKAATREVKPFWEVQPPGQINSSQNQFRDIYPSTQKSIDLPTGPNLS